MNKSILFSIIGIALLITSCATSMTPLQVQSSLPSLTQSTFIPQSQVEEKIATKKCKILVKDRSYVAPIGLTAKEDLRNGAKGIDEWVKIDGGNAYVLKGYKWIPLDNVGTAQLQLNFDTMLCD